MQEQTLILILGGTNFMGKCLIDNLTKYFSNANIHLINRGRKYWNNQVYRENPNIKHFYGDRDQHKQMHKAIQYLNEKVGISASRPWTVVVDFSSYKWRDIQSIAKPLMKKTQLYIFISTDSLYNNTPYNGTPIQQSNFSIEEEYKKLKDRKVSDKYGYDKLKCQIYLQRRKHLPYVSLRLPDVLGPYDNTNRYWCSLEWIKQSDKHPMQINQNDKKKPLSFVYSLDIAKQIIWLIKNRQSVDKYRSYNLSFRETPTYKQFLEQIGKSLTPPIQPTFKQITKQQSNGLYPSTSYTCINSSFAAKEIKWEPSSLSQCIQESTKFFGEKASHYSSQLKEMNRQFKRKVISKD